ncbi:phosphotransferase, partial [Actinoplanes sp. NPDC051633]|uniref:phosphotransferase n=1 Tax=Actinoplanes sp. NPDC051633 TaxID=3155670 RepID=UPI003427E15C
MSDAYALPTPQLPAEQARSLVAERWGIEGGATVLGSQQDANFRIDGPERYVLKVSNPAFTEAELAAQEQAAAHLAAREPGLLIPRSMPGTDGRTLQPVTVGGRPTWMRLLTFLEGGVLSDSRYLAPSVVAALGDLIGRTSRALATFDGRVPPRILQWDLRHAAEVVDRLAQFVDEPEAVRDAAAKAEAALAPHRDRLPVQVIHGDLTDDNVIAALDPAGRRRPAGVIDFGDLTESWAIGELAVTLSSLLFYAEDDLSLVVPAVRAFEAVRPISDDEFAALWPLVVLRAATLAVSGRHQAHIDPGNTYATENLDREWRIFERAVSVPIEVMTALLRGPAARSRVSGRPVLPGEFEKLDLSTT